MINEYQAKRFCSENIELIENYDKAVADKTQTWHLHHRKEIDFGYSRQELQDMNMYFSVPASDLIFLTPSEHRSIHSSNLREETREKKRVSMKGKNKFCGRIRSEESKIKQGETMRKLWEDPIFKEKHNRKQSEEERRRRSEILKGKCINGILSKPVLQFTPEGEFVAEYPSTMEIQRLFGYTNTCISKCCLGKRKTAYKYIWKYK